MKYATGEMERLGLGTSACEPGVDGAKLFVGSLPRTITEDELREFFAKFGAITEVFVMRDSATGTGRGCAFVKMALKEDALYAIQSLAGKHQWEGCSRPLEVRFAESKSQRMQNMGKCIFVFCRLMFLVSGLVVNDHFLAGIGVDVFFVFVVKQVKQE